jgi:NTE family protein
VPNPVQPVEMPMTSGAQNVQEDRLEDCIALCLSGGGYRAMLFHLGVIWYLNDAGYLKKLARISSVSGGSITSGVLALAWPRLTGGDTFQQYVVAPLRRMAATTIDAKSVLGGVFGFGSVSDRVIKSYREILFGDRTLQDLPDEPRFVFNATNVQTGSLMRFSKPYIADWQIGLYLKPTKSVAEAVAASSAFPPVLSPVRLKFSPSDFATDPGKLNKPPFTTEVMLTDGGVYDNMGLETAWKRCKSILVSDAGGKMQPEDKPGANWASHSLRINSLIDNQVRSLRKRQLIWAFDKKERNGSYWGMWSDPQNYPAPSQLALPSDRANALARTPTRLAEMPDELQERLINFGYGMAERAIRSHFDPNALAATHFPYPRGI